MKKWPKKNDVTVSYTALMSPIKKVLTECVAIRDGVLPQYNGYNIGDEELVSSFKPNKRFTEEYMEYEREQGRDILDVIINIIFQLGVEQGRRSLRKSDDIYSRMRLLHDLTKNR